MDKRAAEQYLDKMYGTRQGHVAVAYKDKGQSWQECQFAWPKDKAKIIGWAEVHKDANIFICPALRQDAHTRKKGDMLPGRWLWADVDRQSIPADKIADVDKRIADIGTYIVSSGSGDNAHVYVELSETVDHETFIKLNTGLRDYLYGDNKQADNSLLRLPGTTNWKTDAGSEVSVRGGNGRKTTKANLLRRRAFRDAKVLVDVDSSDWSLVDVGDLGLPRRMQRQLAMSAEEAIGRYGARNKAVYAAVKDLYRRGLDGDQIHSLLDKFPAALDKAAEENGYDRHLDIDRCLARIKQAEDMIVEAETEDLQDQIDEVFEEVDAGTFEEEDFQDEIRRVLRLRAIRRAADQAEAMAGHSEPPADASVSLADALALPPDPVQWLIEGLCSAEANVVLAGQYKSGKTKLMLASLLTALADNEPFLGQKQVHVPEGGAICGHWNLEMSALDVIDKYLRPANFKNVQNVHLANWRGYRLNILTEPGKVAAVEWLKSRNVQVWTLDSWTALCRMCGVDPNSGVEVGQLLGAIDEIKERSGVRVFIFLAHTARSSAESEKPGTRGASEVDDHVDSRWMFTVDKSDVRYLQAEGRDTQLPPTSLNFDEETGRSTLGTASRSTVAADGWIQEIAKIVNAHGDRGINESSLWNKMKEIRKIAKPKAVEYMVEAYEAGQIRREKERPIGQRGGREAWMHYPAVEQAGRGRNATAREVDMRSVRPRRTRRADEE